MYEDDGTLCLLPEAGRVTIYSLRGACGCSHISTATCAAVSEDDRIVVSSRTLIATTTGANIDCPAGCETRPASCTGELPTDGQYLVAYGAEQAVVELPPREPVQLFGSYPPSSCDGLAEDLAVDRAFEQDAAP